jgi:hypothetical protein
MHIIMCFAKNFFTIFAKKNISKWIMFWTNSFMMNKHTILRIKSESTTMSKISVNISQKSLIFFIFYLFYNINIFESLKKSRHKITIIDFVNDINILIYDINTKSNCRALKQTHEECELWTRRHDVRFASIKYELIHLTQNHRRFNMTAFININNVIKKSTISIRMLRIQINIKLKWKSHVRKIQKKMTTQMFALSQLIAFTWEACFKKTRHVYIIVVRSIITYESST